MGNVDGDSKPEIIAYQHVLDLNGERKSLVEGIGPAETVFVMGTPMIVEDNSNSFIVFHAVEVSDLSNLENFTHALYCIRINWDSPNKIIWRHEIEKGDYLTYISNWGELGTGGS